MTDIREAPFALRIVERKGGNAAILYRRKANPAGKDRLQRVAALSPLPFTIATPLLRDGITHAAGKVRATFGHRLCVGRYYLLDADWGARIACYAIVAAGLRNAERLVCALNHLRNSNADEAAWWLGLLVREDNVRALRALRILIEAVE